MKLQQILRPLWTALIIVTLLTQDVVAEDKVNRTVQSAVLGAGEPWSTNYYIIDTGVDGPTVFITGGIHGNEPSGARSAQQIRHWPIVRGKMIVVPRVNTAALDSNLRRTPDVPADLGDVNRNFPSPGIADRPKLDQRLTRCTHTYGPRLHPPTMLVSRSSSRSSPRSIVAPAAVQRTPTALPMWQDREVSLHLCA